MMRGLPVPVRLAARELRGGLKGWRVFLACLALGVAAIATIGSLTAAVEEGIRADGKSILGGDVEMRLVHRPAPDKAVDHLRQSGTLSKTVEMRAMARPKTASFERRTLVELKTVDATYPLYGSFALKPAMPLEDALARKDGAWGAVVDRDLLIRLKVKVGDVLRIGEADVRINGVIEREPDRGARMLILGPRVLVSAGALPATQLLRPGSLVYYRYRVQVPDDTNVKRWVADLKERFPKVGWRIRDLSGATPGLNRIIQRVGLYFTFIGLTALLIGGVGIANAVAAYLAGRKETIATLKCLGAPGWLIFATYLVQIGIIASIGIAIGLVIGAVTPWLLADLVSGSFPLPLKAGIYVGPLLLAALYGVLTALAFSLWPLARARDIEPGALFRDDVSRTRRWPRAPYVAACIVVTGALVALAILTAPDRTLAAVYVTGAALAYLIFRGAADLLSRSAAAAGKVAQSSGGRPRLRLGLANLHRPGSPTSSVVLSLGFGLTVLAAIGQVEGNLMNTIQRQIPKVAPTFFFIDIQSHQVETFEKALNGHGDVEKVRRVPSLRARIVKINGVPVDRAKIAPGARWAVGGERGLTYAKSPPNGSRIVAGKWWPEDYSGPALISLDAGIAAGMDISIGDTLTFNILGREVTARIANLRRINWGSLGMNFTVIFAPGTLEAAPHTHIATVRTAEGRENAVLERVTLQLKNVTAVRVKDAIEAVARTVERIAAAVRAIGGVTLLAGLLVLASAIAAGHRRRVYDSVVLKVLGARRRDVMRVFLVEFGSLGVATALVAGALGTAAGYGIVVGFMRAPWTFLPEPLIATMVLAVLVTLIFGFVGVWRALGRKPAELLRNE